MIKCQDPRLMKLSKSRCNFINYRLTICVQTGCCFYCFFSSFSHDVNLVKNKKKEINIDTS